MSGIYHYHALPSCLTQTNSKKSKLVGYALDGFPIYNGRDEDGKRYTNADLDACHGIKSKIKFSGETVRIMSSAFSQKSEITATTPRRRRKSRRCAEGGTKLVLVPGSAFSMP